MQLVDSHCHLHMLDLEPYEGDVQGVVEEAIRSDIHHLLCVSVELDDHEKILEYTQRFPYVTGSVGVHPNEVPGTKIDSEVLAKLALAPNMVAIGETGLDYFRSQGDLSWQQERFKTHIGVAKELNKPLIIHSRAAKEDTIAILRKERAIDARGVFHCFTEDLPMAEAGLDLGFYISFSGIVTFNNAKDLQQVAKHIPLNRILIETDCPYLAPVPHRGKPNVPAYVRLVAEKIAELKNISLEEVADVTTQNFKDLFKITDIQFYS